MVTVAFHVEVAVTEHKEAVTEYFTIQETVLREHIKLTVCNDRTGQEQLVPSLVTKVMHCLGLGGSCFLNLVCLVSDDKVCIEIKKFLLNDSSTLVVHNDNLESVTADAVEEFFVILACSR